MTRYELLDRIGVGGMAEIFRGRALAAGGFEKPVAIKRILPHLCQDQRFVELLIAEAKVLSLLRHRNIVQIFDVGLGDDGQYFLVMEFVHGLDLGRIQSALEGKRRLVPVDIALHIGAEVCEALEHAHSVKDPDGKPMRLVHRDIAPSNVLVSRSGEVKLTDFGIAKRAEEVTSHGTVRGKFAYISPEQARNEPVDSRSDVFSLGIVLFEILTGRRLFSGLPDLEALRGVREGKIPRPRELDGNLPIEVDELIGKALARDPAKRFSSAGEFGAALRSLRYSLEVSSGDPSAELARIVTTAESPDTIPPRNQFDPGEATVIRIQSAEAFSMNDARTAISQARMVIGRFEEEEETRMSKLGAETLRNLRRAGEEQSGELAVPPAPSSGRRRAPGDTREGKKRDSRPEVKNDRGRNEPSDARGESRSSPRRGSITGDEPTSLADPLEQRLMMAEGDKSFELEEETIARPSPIRPPGPTTLKRVPPPSGPASASSPLPGVRPTPRPSSPPPVLPGPASSPANPAVNPSMMPDAAGWEAPSFSASPYATPPPDRTPPPMMGPGGMPPNGMPNMPNGMPMGGPMSMGGPPSPLAGSPMGPVPNPAAMGGPPSYPYPSYPEPVYPPRPPMLSDGFSQPRPEGTALERWRTAALVLGAIAMAVLAFAVTRSCLHQDKPRLPSSIAPAAPSAPAEPPR